MKELIEKKQELEKEINLMLNKFSDENYIQSLIIEGGTTERGGIKMSIRVQIKISI